MACFIDSEGCILINRQTARKSKPTFSVGLTIANTYEPAIRWAYETFGGSLQHRRPRPGWKDCFVCYQWCTTAYRTLQRTMPFMKIKHEQARLAVEFYERMVVYSETPRIPLTEEERAWREEQYLLLKRLNSG